ncbi:hypothetical protein ACFSFY_11180 [Sporosarcina siberiensis]|uniref:Uncharacterized protein n=1 Tax=Sporosarcina siberiensis TaxID=1365606 RepID=A0ABW4SGF7_9BACL
MNKLFLLLFLSILMIAGCSSSKSQVDTNETTPISEKETEKPTVTEEADAEIVSEEIEVRIPGRHVGDADPESVVREYKSVGIEEVNYNEKEDSYSLIMTSNMQGIFLMAISNNVKTLTSEAVEDGYYPTFKQMNFNDDFTMLEVIADEQIFNEETDGLVIAEIADKMTYYQVFNKVPDNKVQLDVTLKDESSGKVFDKLTFN